MAQRQPLSFFSISGVLYFPQRIGVTQTALASGSSVGIPPPDSWSSHIVVAFEVNMRVKSSPAMRIDWQSRERAFKEVIDRYLSARILVRFEAAVRSSLRFLVCTRSLGPF